MVTNRVYKVLVTNGTQMADLSDTGAGEYLVIDASGAALTSTSTLSRNDYVQVVVNDPSGNKVYSDRIRVGDITAYNKQDYTAKTEKIVTLTPGTITAGNEYTVAVINKSDKELLQCRQAKSSYSVVAATGETASTLVAKFVALINADVNSVVTASGTTTLVLTADATNTANLAGEYPAQTVFEVFASEIDNSVSYAFPTAFGTQADTAAPAFGSGNFWQVRKLEQRGIGYTGVSNRTKFPVETGNFLSVSGTNYDAVVIEVDNTHDTNVVVEGQVKSPESLIIFVNEGLGDATIIPILDNLNQADIKPDLVV